MAEYLAVGFILWLLLNSFGANLGIEAILGLPALVVIIFIALLIVA